MISTHQIQECVHLTDVITTTVVTTTTAIIIIIITIETIIPIAVIITKRHQYQ